MEVYVVEARTPSMLHWGLGEFETNIPSQDIAWGPEIKIKCLYGNGRWLLGISDTLEGAETLLSASQCKSEFCLISKVVVNELISI